MFELLAQTYTTYTTTTTSVNTAGAGMAFGTLMFIYFVVWVLMIVALWKVFTKAGQPGWACIIPIYNVYVLLKIAERPGWWLLLYFIPFVNFIILIIVSLDIAKRFGKGVGFAIFGLIIFSIIGYMILGYGDAQYSASGSAPAAPAGTPPATA